MRSTDIRYIVVHCSATRASQSYSPEALERDHRTRGFRSAGYHFYIRRSGAIIPLRLEHLHTLAPQATILGHRDLSPDRNGDGRITPDEWIKLCPCFDAQREYHDISISPISHATK